MNCITNQVFFFAFTAFVQYFYNSLHICKGRRLLAIYYVKFLKVFSLRSPGYFFHLFLDILYWSQKALLFLCRDPVPGKWVCRFSWNLRFSGFLNALGCGFYHDKFFFIRVYKDINVLTAVTFAVLPVRIKELVYGNVQQGDDLVKGIQVWLWGRYAVLCFSSILSTYSMTTLIDWKNGGKINADKIWDSIIDTYFSAIFEKLEVEQCRRF